MGIWILIAVIGLGNSAQSVTAEFYSKEACLNAASALKEEFVWRGETIVRGAVCAHKGEAH